VTGRAVLSPDGVYRYVLERLFQPELDRNRGRVLFVMLNPSTADALEDDPTVRRCVGFAQAWGYTELAVANLFAYRSVVPSKLYDITVDDPVGPDNDHWISTEAKRADLTVCAWGVHGRHLDRDRAVLALLADAGVRPHALGLTRDLQPRHPLYMRGDAEPFVYRGRP
jgi:hypothetical protein